MAYKFFEFGALGQLRVSKNRGSRHIRLSISASGEARVSIPPYLPYAAGYKFALSKQDWLATHMPSKNTRTLQDGARIGKSYRLSIDSQSAVDSVVLRGQQIIVTGHPKAADIVARCEAALKKDAEKLLPMRLETLAARHCYTYKGVRIRKMTSRWGSCSSEKLISLSYYLIQLPWELADYVILHELNHTRHMSHGKDFWQDMDRLVPDARAKRKILKQYKSAITPIAS